MLMGIVRGGSGGYKGKNPIRVESLNNPAPIISSF